VRLLTGLFVLLAVVAIVLLAYAFSMRAEMY
jgi:Tfp pilus assembly protein PilO